MKFCVVEEIDVEVFWKVGVLILICDEVCVVDGIGIDCFEERVGEDDVD